MPVLEHTLIILLLLVGLLNSRALRGPWWWIVGAILALALISPIYPVSLPWPWLAGLVIPLLFWQTAHRLSNARLSKEIKLLDFALWIGVAFVLGSALWLVGDMIFSGALLFGLLIASMVWRAAEEEQRPSYLGQIGPLMLAYLLAEIAPAVESPGRYQVALAGGALVGILTGFVAVRAAEAAPAGRKRVFLSLGQGYAAYLLGLLFGLSGVAASITSSVVYAAYGARRGLWETGVVQPRPLDSRTVFAAAVAILAFLAWQTHIPLTPILLLDLILGLAIVSLMIWIGRSKESYTFREEHSSRRVFARVGLLLAPALLLWPRQALLEPEPLAIALVAAVATTYAAHIGITPLLNLYAYLDEAHTAAQEGSGLFKRLLVKDMMMTSFPTVSPETRVADLTGLVVEEGYGCLPVVDSAHRLLGMITEEELFLKEENLPRSMQTYMVLFGEPVFPEDFAEAYAEISEPLVATDVMAKDILWVSEEKRVCDAVQLMVSTGVKCLPVLSGDPKAGGELVGLLTRAHIIRSISSDPLRNPSTLPKPHPDRHPR